MFNLNKKKMVQKIKKFFTRSAAVGLGAFSLMCSVATILPATQVQAKAEAAKYPVLNLEWDCIGCGGNCAAFICSC